MCCTCCPFPIICELHLQLPQEEDIDLSDVELDDLDDDAGQKIEL